MGRGGMESLNRATRTAFFMVIMIGSLLASSAPLLLCFVDSVAPCFLLSAFSCCHTCFAPKQDWIMNSYSFRTSLLDFPLLSFIRSVLIFGAYSACGMFNMTYGFYLGMATVCGLISGLWLGVKAAVFSASHALPLSSSPNLGPVHLKQAWAMPSLLLSSLLLALFHATVAYRIRSHDRRRFLFHRLDPEAVLACKIALNRCQSFPRAASKMQVVRASRSDSVNGKLFATDDRDLPAHMLADKDSLFMACGNLLILHYKTCEGWHQTSEPRTSVRPTGGGGESHCEKKDLGTFLSRSSKDATLSSSLYTPLLNECSTTTGDSNNSWKDLSLEGLHRVEPYRGCQKASQTGIVLIHGFGGGVFSWRHVMNPLACQAGLSVYAFDRPGWGLTSRPSRVDWEGKGSSNPFELDSQVDLLFLFCKGLNLSSVVLVGHDDGGVLALVAAAASAHRACQVEVKGVVLIGASLFREVMPAFARVLLHTSLGRHMLRPLLRSEIGQVAVRRAWHDASKLTSDILDLYKAPLRVEGWDRALKEISRASSRNVVSTSNSAEVFKLLHCLPCLVVAGAEDNLVPLRSAQALAMQLPHSRIVAISGCGHFPHEESPGALLAALVPFVSSLDLAKPS